MLRQSLEIALQKAVTDQSEALNGIETTAQTMALLKLERPRQKGHGDFAVNVSPLAKLTRLAPQKIAEIIGHALSQAGWDVALIGGFLNLKLNLEQLLSPVVSIALSPQPGKNSSLGHQRILLEYVSANPTGPLHIGHGRWAALGDSLVRLWRHCGASVSTEFYVNDAGVQMRNIAIALYRRCLEVLVEQGDTQAQEAQALFTEDIPYPGEYVLTMARDYLSDEQRKNALCAQTVPLADAGKPTQHAELPPLLLKPLQTYCQTEMLAEQQTLLESLGVRFDRFFCEQADLYDKQLPQQALEKLKASGKVYNEAGAIWFRSTEYGDEKDRVLQKQDGSFTYLTPDIAYHDDKFNRLDTTGTIAFNRIVNIWGADHHGYIPRMRAAIEALGHPVSEFEVILGQLVNLIIDGEKTRMGKRRKMLTLADVVEEVGVDATRLWMVWKPAETALDFDVDLAQSTTNDNPVFYIQYAHARCCGIIRNATEPQLDADSGQTLPPRLGKATLDNLLATLTNKALLPMLDGFSTPDTQPGFEAIKQLILKLDGFDDMVIDAGRINSPHLIARYAVDLSSDFHSFYQVCRVINDDQQVMAARLALIFALQKTLAQALALLGVSAPQRM